MPRAALGQHFLVDQRVALRIVDALQVSHGDRLLEIGPGRGALTHHLVPLAEEIGAFVVLLELDEQLADSLERRYRRVENVEVVCGDARDVDLRGLEQGGAATGRSGAIGEAWKVVGNLPYYAGTPIVRHLLESGLPMSTLVVMLQREVVQDMVAVPPNMSLLSLAVQIFACGTPLFDVEPSAFSPPPKVRSSVLRLTPHDAPRADVEQRDRLFRVARGCFRGKRKQLHNSLANGLGIKVAEAKALGASAGIDTGRRPGTLTIAEWQALADAWAAGVSAGDASSGATSG